MLNPLGYLMQVQRGIDHVESHLEAGLQLRDVSEVAGISHWHFQRIFKALTGETLKVYVRSRRLANSLERLRESDDRILDLALEAGFESQESFTRAFAAAFGMTPGAYRKRGDRSLFLQKIRIDADYLRHIQGNVSLEPQLILQPAMRLVGLRTEFYGVDSDKNNIAEKLPALWDAFLAKLSQVNGVIPGPCYGVIQQVGADEERLIYHAAIQVEPTAKLPAGMSEVFLPETPYAKFTHAGPVANLDHTVNYIYSAWLAQSGRRHSYGADLEFYGADYHPTAQESVMEYAIPIV